MEQSGHSRLCVRINKGYEINISPIYFCFFFMLLLLTMNELLFLLKRIYTKPHIHTSLKFYKSDIPKGHTMLKQRLNQRYCIKSSAERYLQPCINRQKAVY